MQAFKSHLISENLREVLCENGPCFLKFRLNVYNIDTCTWAQKPWMRRRRSPPRWPWQQCTPWQQQQQQQQQIQTSISFDQSLIYTRVFRVRFTHQDIRKAN